MNVLDEVEGKVVIWAHFQRDVNRIIEVISKKYGEDSFVDYYGLTPQKIDKKILKSFKIPGLRLGFL